MATRRLTRRDEPSRLVPSRLLRRVHVQQPSAACEQHRIRGALQGRSDALRLGGQQRHPMLLVRQPDRLLLHGGVEEQDPDDAGCEQRREQQRPDRLAHPPRVPPSHGVSLSPPLSTAVAARRPAGVKLAGCPGC